MAGFGLKFRGDGVEAELAAFFDFEEAGFAHDAEVFGDVGLGEVELFGDLGDAETLLVEKAKDTEPGFFAERFEGADASEAVHAVTE